MTKLSIVMPVLDEAAEIEAALAALAPYRARGVEVIVVDGGSSDGTPELARPLADRVIAAPRGRSRADECRRRRGTRRRAAVPARRHASAGERRPAGARRPCAFGPQPGAASTCASTAAACCALIAVDDEPALAPDRHRHRRPGDVHDPRGIRTRGRLSADRADGGRGAVGAAQAHRPPARLARARDHLGAALAGARHAAHRAADVAAAACAFSSAPIPASWRGPTAMPAATTSSVAIAILAKAPVPGLAKTRLIPSIGAHAAAVLQERMTERTVATALAADIGPVTLWCAPDPSHASFRDLVARLPRRAQAAAGRRSRRAHARRHRRRRRPYAGDRHRLPGLHGGAFCARPPRRCDDADVVLIPAEDGGYVLIGARAAHPQLFSGIAWGTAAVMQETRARIAALGLESDRTRPAVGRRHRGRPRALRAAVSGNGALVTAAGSAPARTRSAARRRCAPRAAAP